MDGITIPGSAAVGRLIIDDTALAHKVAEVVATFITAGQQFTAYDVTQALRKQLRTTDIEHARVRLIVNEGMRRTVVMQTGDWETIDGVEFRGGTARLYRPYQRPTTPWPVQLEPKITKQLPDLNAPTSFEPL